MSSTKKQITFDIDTNVAKQIFGTNYTKVYDDIERSLKKHFDHPQGSVYVSKKPMTTASVYIHVSNLKQKYPYLEKCIRDISYTDSPKKTSLNHLFSYDGTAGQYKKFNLPLQTKNAAGNFLKRTVTIEEATELLNNKIPFNAQKVDSKVLIVFDKSLKSKIDDVITKLHQKNNIKPKR